MPVIVKVWGDRTPPEIEPVGQVETSVMKVGEPEPVIVQDVSVDMKPLPLTEMTSCTIPAEGVSVRVGV